MCPDGPRVRDRIAHGELGVLSVTLDSLSASLRVALVAIIWRATVTKGGVEGSDVGVGVGSEFHATGDHRDRGSMADKETAFDGICVGCDGGEDCKGNDSASSRCCVVPLHGADHNLEGGISLLNQSASVDASATYPEACSRALATYHSRFHPHALAQYAVLELARDTARWLVMFPPVDSRSGCSLFDDVPTEAEPTVDSTSFAATRAAFGRPPQRLRDACGAATIAVRKALTCIALRHDVGGALLPDHRDSTIAFRIDCVPRPSCEGDHDFSGPSDDDSTGACTRCWMFRAEHRSLAKPTLSTAQPLQSTRTPELGRSIDTSYDATHSDSGNTVQGSGINHRDVALWFSHRRIAVFEGAGNVAGSRAAHRVCDAARRLVDAVTTEAHVAQQLPSEGAYVYACAFGLPQTHSSPFLIASELAHSQSFDCL
jgi:hypothetical protein